ncbi:MAG: CDP-diacylglycerol--glycerol-3-phosphate 3-phosphatidyltransferase [Acidimicrobiales bacterium]|nr:CDP-diacylglycerol--glycerol-3-phosphate 3-phosphatidyltransferase [Acidimicrobiales bacterium]
MNLFKHFGTVVSPPNLVTLSRLALSPVLFVIILEAQDRRGVSWGAFLLGFILGLTDYMDGSLARRAGKVSRWGAFLDPLADKVAVIGAAVCLVAVDRYTWLPVILLAVREVLITFYRLWFARQGLAVPARKSAKAKTTVQGLALLVAVIPLFENFDWLVEATLWAAVVLTLVTGLQYLLDGRNATNTTGE